MLWLCPWLETLGRTCWCSSIPVMSLVGLAGLDAFLAALFTGEVDGMARGLLIMSVVIWPLALLLLPEFANRLRFWNSRDPEPEPELEPELDPLLFWFLSMLYQWGRRGNSPIRVW